MKKKELAEKVARKVGCPPITVIVDEGRINPSSYLRARVFMDLDKPLVRVVPITIKESRRYLVQYEKLPIFCYVCGVMGHEMTECGDGVHDLSKCQWGDWLLVKFPSSSVGRGLGCGGGGRGGWSSRGRGRGRGMAGEVGDEEDIEIYDEELDNSKLALVPGASSVLVESPEKIQEKKRQRMEGASGGTVQKVVKQLSTASSLEEGRRAQ